MQPLIQHDTVAVVIEKNRRFLLIKRANPPENGFWAVPGGHVENGESVRDAAIRESLEEVGKADVEDTPFLVFIHDAGIGHRHRAHIFRGKLQGKAKPGTDAKEAKWFSIGEMKAVELTHYTKKIFNYLVYGDIK